MHTAFYYTERVTEQLDLICGYTADTALYTITSLPYTKSGIFPRIRKWSLFASFTPTSRGKFNRYPEPLGVGIRFITIKIEALGSYKRRYIG